MEDLQDDNLEAEPPTLLYVNGPLSSDLAVAENENNMNLSYDLNRVTPDNTITGPVVQENDSPGNERSTGALQSSIGSYQVITLEELQLVPALEQSHNTLASPQDMDVLNLVLMDGGKLAGLSPEEQQQVDNNPQWLNVDDNELMDMGTVDTDDQRERKKILKSEKTSSTGRKIIFEMINSDGSFHQVDMSTPDEITQTVNETAQATNSILDTCGLTAEMKDERASVLCESAAESATSIRQSTSPINCNTPKCSEYKCDLCDGVFKSAVNCARHRMIHNVNTEKAFRYKCETCGRYFLQNCDLKRHELIHTNSYPFSCEYCGKGYLRRSDRDTHMKFHTKEKTHHCIICDKSFYQSGDLYRHVRNVHGDSSEYIYCTHCTSKFVSNSTLMKHITIKHRDKIDNALKRTASQSQ